VYGHLNRQPFKNNAAYFETFSYSLLLPSNRKETKSKGSLDIHIGIIGSIKGKIVPVLN
jgi:hypothetical protein